MYDPPFFPYSSEEARIRDTTQKLGWTDYEVSFPRGKVFQAP